MQAIEPTEWEPRAPRRSLFGGLGRRIGVPLAVLATASGLVGLGRVATDSLRDAERVVARSYEASAALTDRTGAASAALTRLRAAHARLRSTSEGDERRHLERELSRDVRSLLASLGMLAGRTRSLNADHAILAAQDAVTIWHESARAEPGSPHSDTVELDRLASIAEAQLTRFAGFAAGDEEAARRRAEAAVSDRIALIEGTAGGTLAFVLLAGWFATRRGRQGPAAPAGGLDAREAPAADDRVSPDGGLAAVLRAVPDGVIVLDADRRIVHASASAAALLGVRAEALRQREPVPSALIELGPEDSEGARDLCLEGGRWLRVNRSPMPGGGTLVLFADIGERKASEARAWAAADNLRTALDSMSQGLCLYDVSHRLMLTNRRYEEIYALAPGTLRAGMTTAEVLQCGLAAGNHPGQTLDDLLAEAEQIVTRGEQNELFQEIAGGRIVQINLGPTADGGLLATYEDITERWHAESRIAYMARHDGLTGLPNRLLLAERIEGAITLAGRDSGFAVHCLDLDHFKQINDTLGHAVGDELLRAVAHRLTACLRDVDTVARLGGDEFAIIQATIEGPQDAVVLARRVIEVVSAPYELTDHRVTIGVSIGIALSPCDGMAADRLLKNADVALYKAKGDGRGVFRFFEAEMGAHLEARRLLEIDLRAAAAAEAFELHYQPIYDLSQERITGFEALLRWTHPTRGRVSPAEFVPLAEEIGLIVPLGEWVLRKACAEASRWPGDLKIAVNVSPAQFRSAGLIHAVRGALDEAGLDPRRLELEITETVLLVNGGATVAILHALRCLGTRISMDDFGTGYSSLSYLRSFPFDKMKIDQSFIRDLTVENGSGFIVKAVISLGSSLGMTMTAEGVETEAQLARLREEGCDEVQGYLFSPPVPARQIAGLLEKWNGANAVAQAA